MDTTADRPQPSAQKLPPSRHKGKDATRPTVIWDPPRKKTLSSASYDDQAYFNTQQAEVAESCSARPTSPEAPGSRCGPQPLKKDPGPRKTRWSSHHSGRATGEEKTPSSGSSLQTNTKEPEYFNYSKIYNNKLLILSWFLLLENFDWAQVNSRRKKKQVRAWSRDSISLRTLRKFLNTAAVCELFKFKKESVKCNHRLF